MANRRPRVVVYVDASADGKVTLTPEQILMDQPSGGLWADMFSPGRAQQRWGLTQVMAKHDATAVLEGSGTFVSGASEVFPLPAADISGDGHQDFLPAEITSRPSPPYRWFTVVDGRGRVRWTQDQPNWNLLVLVAQSTPAAYLSHLRRQQICHLVAGEDHVDLAAALTKMRTRLGVESVISNAGGGLNGALLRAGLIDEVYITIAPALIGGRGTPSIMDGPPLVVGDAPTGLRLLSVDSDAAGFVRLHYEVARDR